MAEKQKQKSAAKDVKEARNEPRKKTTEPSPQSPISYVYLVSVSVVVVMVAVVFNSEGTLRLLGLQCIPVDPKPSIDKANIIQPDIGNLDHKLETIPDSKVEPKVEPKQTNILKDIVEEEAKTKPETDQKDKEQKKPKKPKKDYAKRNITNELDYEIRAQLDEGDALLEEGDYRAALSVFNDILLDYPESPRALWGKGCATDDRADEHRNNTILDEAIGILKKVFYHPSAPKALVIEAGRRLAERQKFRGSRRDAANTWQYLATHFPHNYEIQLDFGIRLESMGDFKRAKLHFQKMQSQYPNSGIIKCHLGYLVMGADESSAIYIPLLEECIESGEPETVVHRYYARLGNAYIKTGQREKADALFESGAEKGMFLSRYQRSGRNADTPISGRPWWTIEQTTYGRHYKRLEENWETIRDEAMALVDRGLGVFPEATEKIQETGEWRVLRLYLHGRKVEEICMKCPKTCALLEDFTAATGCKMGQIKYSIMMPGVHLWPHTGPTNCRIRAHLGLVVPDGPVIRVVNETRHWEEGKIFVFDDSFEHEVWHYGDSFRLVLIIDAWHPEIPQMERERLSRVY